MAAPIQDPVDYCLYECGLLFNAERQAIVLDGFANFDDLLTTGDVSDMTSRSLRGMLQMAESILDWRGQRSSNVYYYGYMIISWLMISQVIVTLKLMLQMKPYNVRYQERKARD